MKRENRTLGRKAVVILTLVLALLTAFLLAMTTLVASPDEAQAASSSETQTMYRLYNPNSGEHFYTASAGERDSVQASGWNYEGVAWTAPVSSNTPVYRLYSGTDHHYTTSVAERDNLMNAGWKYENIGWYSDDAKGVPLYRQFNPNVDPTASFNNSGSHNYTTSKGENDHLVSLGWIAEDIGWYGVYTGDNTIYIENASYISLGGIHSAAIKSDGSLWMWGDNTYGQLGDGTTTSRDTPVKVMDSVASVSLGNYHSAAIKTDGTLWTWGDNGSGQLGDGTWTDRTTPMKIMDNVVSISLGANHSAAIKTDGTLWTWGDNYHGQLGNGTTTWCSPIPVRVMDNVASVSLGNYHSAAVKTDGSLWTWGYNKWGQLGIGVKDTDLHSVPTKVMDNVASVSLGGFDDSAAIKSDGTLWTWGYNQWGQIGDGTTKSRYSPVKVMDNVVSVSLGVCTSAAIKTDGSLWMWGWNDAGALGIGVKEDDADAYPVPTKVMDNVASVSLGGCSAAVKTDGTLWTWGWNYYGQLGDGTTTSRTTPVKIMEGVKI